MSVTLDMLQSDKLASNGAALLSTHFMSVTDDASQRDASSSKVHLSMSNSSIDVAPLVFQFLMRPWALSASVSSEHHKLTAILSVELSNGTIDGMSDGTLDGKSVGTSDGKLDGVSVST